MLQAGVLKLVYEATPWINNFVLVERKDKLGNLNLNKAITRKAHHFRMPEDIAHLLANACIMTVCDCKTGYWHQRLDEASSFLTTFNAEIGRFRYTVMPFGATVARDVGKQQNHRNHNIALTTLLETVRKCNVRLNFDKLEYKKTEVDLYMDASHSVL